jgi:ribulose-5-phosphate 4-epimerase/fuculose-1-phosphate aldolase
MPRFVSPGGASVDDMIEYDLESTPVDGPRNDNAREIYLHGEIYKARPDIMAIVHSHTPEFVAFGASSVPLWNGAERLPVFDLRPFNGGRSGIIGNHALGQAMAQAMGKAEAVLLWGHGIALGAPSLQEAVSRVDALRDSARLQQAAVALGGTWTPQARADRAGTADRTWEYYKRAVLRGSEGRVPAEPDPLPQKPSDPDQASMHDLVLANRILASDDLQILDTIGHVSVRNPRNPNSYFVSPRVAAGAVTPGDIVQRDITKAEADTVGLSIHDEIYKARPDVMAILYATTPEVVAFTGPVRLRPIVNGGAFIGEGYPVFNMTGVDLSQPLLAQPTLGSGVAAAMGKSAAVLLPGNGYVLTAGSIYNLVDRAYALKQNAEIQRQAIALRGRVQYLEDQPAPAGAAPQAAEAQGGRGQGGGGAQAGGGGGQQLGPPEGRAWVFWSQNVELD